MERRTFSKNQMRRVEMKAVTPSEMSRLLSEGLLVGYRKMKKMLVNLRNLQKLTNMNQTV